MWLSDAFSPVLLSRIEDASLNASAPPQQRWLDGWLLRLSPGKAQRARSVNAVANGVLPLAERLALCEQAFQAAKLPALVRLTPFSQPAELDAVLARMGFERADDSLVMVCLVLPTGRSEFPSNTYLEAVNHEAYAHIVGEFRGSAPGERQAHAERMANSPVPYCGLVLRNNDGTPLACGQEVLESGMVGLYDVFTAPAWRGRGLAGQLCSHLLGQSKAKGAQVAYLQVDAKNAAARAVYQRLGFGDAYSYHYRKRI